MGFPITLFMYAVIVALLFAVAYFVIKEAVKDALREYKNENNK